MRTFSLASIIVMFSSVSLMLSSSSCDAEKEQEPVYIQIDTMVVNSPTGASNTNKAENVWVIVDRQLLGVRETYDLYGNNFVKPVFPSLTTGTAREVQIQGGIAENGVRETRVAYPFWSTYTATLDLIPGQVKRISPTFSYLPSALFAYEEDFEGGGITFGAEEIDGNLNTTMRSSTTTPYSGVGCGNIHIDTANPLCVVTSNNPFSVGNPNNKTFLEIHYRCTNSFTIGLLDPSSPAPKTFRNLITLLPRNTWGKVYINLTRGTSALNVNDFQLRIVAQVDRLRTEGDIWIDNVRVVTTR